MSSPVSGSEPSTPFIGPVLRYHPQALPPKYQSLRRQSTPAEFPGARNGHVGLLGQPSAAQDDEGTRSYSGPWLAGSANGPMQPSGLNPAVLIPAPPFTGLSPSGTFFGNPAALPGHVLPSHHLPGLDPMSLSPKSGNCHCGPQCSCYMCATHPFNETTVRRVEMLHRELQSQLENISKESQPPDAPPGERGPSDTEIYPPEYDLDGMSQATVVDPSVMIDGGFPSAMDANYMDVMYPSSFDADPSIAESCSRPYRYLPLRRKLCLRGMFDTFFCNRRDVRARKRFLICTDRAILAVYRMAYLEDIYRRCRWRIARCWSCAWDAWGTGIPERSIFLLVVASNYCMVETLHMIIVLLLGLWKACWRDEAVVKDASPICMP